MTEVRNGKWPFNPAHAGQELSLPDAVTGNKNEEPKQVGTLTDYDGTVLETVTVTEPLAEADLHRRRRR